MTRECIEFCPFYVECFERSCTTNNFVKRVRLERLMREGDSCPINAPGDFAHCAVLEAARQALVADDCRTNPALGFCRKLLAAAEQS